MSSASDNLQHVTAINAVAQKALLKTNTKLDHAVSNSRAHGLPPIAVSALAGQYLAIQAQLIDAKNVLEIGTLGGYSTIWFASTGAHVTSIEINPKHRDVALENIKAAGYEDKVNIRLGAALDVLPLLANEGKQFDLVFIDADWGEQWEYFDWAVKLTRHRGCIFVDNVVREMLESDQLSGKGNGGLVGNVGKDERVQATLVSTVSSHRRRAEEMFDGFLLAVVKGEH